VVLIWGPTFQYRSPEDPGDGVDSQGEPSTGAASNNNSVRAGTLRSTNACVESPTSLVEKSRSPTWIRRALQREGATARIEPFTILTETLVHSLGITDSKACRECDQNIQEQRGTRSLTPGGLLKKRARSEVQSRFASRVYVKPHNVSLILDSLAVVSGTTKEVKRNLTIGFGLDNCSNIERG
jgi:hypothetical protein